MEVNFHGSWTERQLECCITLWRAGASARFIAERIGKSRSAVIGKMGRMFIRQGEPAPKPVLRGTPTPEPPPEPVLPPSDYAARICRCGGPAQPGRGLCASCLNKRHRPNPRASMFVGMMRNSA